MTDQPEPPADGEARLFHARKRVVLIAHDNRKADMLEWARFNRDTLAAHELFATACNRATADFVLSSPLMATEYRRSHAAGSSV